jgi:tetratricopeptide (TPR) repeat protein
VLSLYIEFLLRHGGTQATDEVENSASEASNSVVADRKDVFLSEAEARLDDLRQLQAGNSDGVQALVAAFQARLLQARGREKDAKACVADFVARQTRENRDQNHQARRDLAVGRLYSLIGAHAEAEKWYRRLEEFTPDGFALVAQSLLAQGRRQDAIEYCLGTSDGKPTPEMATLLANMMTATDEPVAEFPKVKAAIETAMEDYSENIDLLQAEAVRRASRGHYEGAIAILRRILALDPHNVLTLNNLATILAESPNQRAEALEHIQRAIEIAGRQAPLLDTQGTILLKIGDAEQAIDCLEEATAGGAADARFYLHLAAAYHQAGRDEDALRMLMESRAFGLESFVLTADDRNLLAALNKQLDSLVRTADTPR